MEDMFDAQRELEIQRALNEMVKNNPERVIEAYATQNKMLKKQLAIKESELEEVSGKYNKFLSADGFMDVSEVAERIKIPYIDPSGKRQFMGRTYFCKLLKYDRILLHKATGYGLYAECSPIIKENAKVVSKEQNGMIKSSVKLNARALEWLDDKYSNDDRVWHSTPTKELYYEQS